MGSTMGNAMRSLAIPLAAALLAAAVLAPAPATAQADTGKWVVLRIKHGSQCWTARVIRIGGEYATGSALIAGGPYDTEEQARQRLAELAQRGTCRSG